MLRILLFILLLSLNTPVFAQEEFLVDEVSGVRYTVERYVSALFPTGIAFAPDGRMFYNEKETGLVRVVSADGVTQIDPVIHFPTSALTERGLIGIAFDPDYEQNQMIWIFHTAAGTARDFPANRVVRFREEGGVGSEPEIMFNLPIENGLLIHNGGNLRFDDEGYLYVSIGDYGEAENAQNLNVPYGKIHRFAVTTDGLAPAPNNPYEGNSIFAYGFRNPFDFVIDPVSGNVFATENGPNCDDEVNLVLRGFNYGWGAEYKCSGTDIITGLPLYNPPLLSYTPPISPTGITIYNHPAVPEWEGNLFFCDFNFGEMQRVVLNESRTKVKEVHVVDLGDIQCRLDVEVGPDGAIYFGTIGEGDGAIYRLVPVGTT